MRSILALLVFSIAYLASAVPVDEPDHGQKHEYQRFFKFTDEEGKLQEIDLEAEPDMELLEEVNRNAANNQYLLFTRRNPDTSQILSMNFAETITSSYFDASKPTVVIVHGWLRNQLITLNPTVRDAFLDKSDVNVIVMEWRQLALSEYVTAANGVPAVGRGLGRFLRFLNSVTGAPFSSMHLVGFSLGAHLVGNAGRELEGQVARITGLDPSGPLWSVNSNRLGPSDAIYVEAIHTDGGYTLGGLGIGSAIAQVDFFPNGGVSQPGCLTSVCNHNRSWELFAATITYNHLVGQQCSNSLQVTLNICRGADFHMGNDDLNKTGSGIYRLDTRWRYPF